LQLLICSQGLPDVQRLLLRIGRGKATLQDVVKLYQAVQALPTLLAYVSASVSQSFRDKYQNGVAQLVSDFANFCSMVESTLDLEALKSEGAFRLRATFDENLQVLATGMSGQMRVIRAEHERAKEWAKKVELEEKKGHGLVLRAGKAQEKGIVEAAKKAKAELVELSSTKSGFLFRTVKMEKAARQHGELQREYDRVQSALVAQLMDVVRGYAPAVEGLAELFSDLDVYCALAHAAASSPLPYVRPRLTLPATGNTVIKGKCLVLFV
jgi:DNA mismatch repair protein MSH2